MKVTKSINTRILDVSDREILIGPIGRPSRSTTARLAGMAEAARGLTGVVDAVPGTQSLLLEIDAAHRDSIKKSIVFLSHAEPRYGKTLNIPSTYDGEDLEWAANHLGITQQALADIHSSRVYDVRMIGSPGFIYLSNIPQSIRLPRLADPRKKVEKGTVGIGGKQTGIYGLGRPGGWRLIAHVSEVPEVQVGDRIRFVPTR